MWGSSSASSLAVSMVDLMGIEMVYWMVALMVVCSADKMVVFWASETAGELVVRLAASKGSTKGFLRAGAKEMQKVGDLVD